VLAETLAEAEELGVGAAYLLACAAVPAAAAVHPIGAEVLAAIVATVICHVTFAAGSALTDTTPADAVGTGTVGQPSAAELTTAAAMVRVRAEVDSIPSLFQRVVTTTKEARFIVRNFVERSVAVLVDTLWVTELHRPGVHGGRGVVAVGGRVEAIIVGVIDQSAVHIAGAVLGHAVTAPIGGSGEGPLIGVVAIGAAQLGI